ncbi:hypothetical protein BMS3Abin05_00153 [bacterium BMS3Abin05]|nr:hypothetical protein BMS3Abin05_00153 [bacterium BMS3Abin05]HDK36137.1 CAP domain-containing protein [Bacteroidota bacterium]
MKMRFLPTTCFFLAAFLFSCTAGISQKTDSRKSPEMLSAKRLTARDSLRIRRGLLKQINRDRQRHGLSPVKLDLPASRVGDRHCREMAREKYMSHWNLQGLKPYHRYAFAGGRDHISENLYSATVWGQTFTCTVSDISGKMRRAEQSFMSEKPPYDGHRKNILESYHTHVGIGFACTNDEFRMAEEFVDRYVILDKTGTKIYRGEKKRISGKILRHRLYPIMAVVNYEPVPARKSKKELKKTGPYLDGSRYSFQTISAWEMSFYPKSRRFSFTLDFAKARAGIYYMILYLDRKIDQSLYQNSGLKKRAGTFRLSTRHAIPATGVVFRLE